MGALFFFGVAEDTHGLLAECVVHCLLSAVSFQNSIDQPGGPTLVGRCRQALLGNPLLLRSQSLQTGQLTGADGPSQGLIHPLWVKTVNLAPLCTGKEKQTCFYRLKLQLEIHFLILSYINKNIPRYKPGECENVLSNTLGVREQAVKNIGTFTVHVSLCA